MRILFTAMNEKYVLGECDTKTKKINLTPTPMIIEDHRPFGITWDRKYGSIFIAQPTSIWEFDFNLNFKKIIVQNLWYGLHQITAFEKDLWIVSPRINGLQKIDFQGLHKDFFFPSTEKMTPNLPNSFKNKDRLSYDEDISHYNSILFHKNHLYLTAHNHGSSFIEIFDQEFKKKRTINEIGTQAHNVLVDDTIWWVDSLGKKAIVSEDGQSIKIGKDGDFIRGLAGTKEYFITSKFNYSKKRENRRIGNSEIIIVQRNPLKIVEKITIEGIGNINDIRITDIPDLAHNVLPISKSMIF